RGTQNGRDVNHERISVPGVRAVSQQRLTSFDHYESAWRTQTRVRIPLSTESPSDAGSHSPYTKCVGDGFRRSLPLKDTPKTDGASCTCPESDRVVRIARRVRVAALAAA